ncbi:DUF221 family protein [Desarmillaria tabescens]|uniref:DUF221 family protein n=1 Tax=Armillaria tabescens TaxID=1929756 RepID=A0AA39TZ28_ARMTA|nr:DUF221 family protein [Desarmillaria tabescens]KAK0463530.1 DUF221 family protein [Desarmillaria tabescens]
MSVTAEQASNNSTTKTFVTALVVNGALLAAEVGAFLILKQKLGRIYSPRTFLPPPDKRAEELPKGFWRWIPAILMSPPEDIIHKNGLDSYMFLRFIKMLIWIFAVFTFFTMVTIVPVNVVGVQSSITGLDRISWSNIVNKGDQKRFAAHIVVVYLLTFFVFYLIRREMLHFVHMRHQFLISKSHSRLAQARTVLITSVPIELANEHDMREFASFIPGGVDRVWFYRDKKVLNELFEERQELCGKLESAEADVLKQATKAWRAKQAAHKKALKRKPKDEESKEEPELVLSPASQELLDELVPAKKRPTHRIGFLGIFGHKVDTVKWCKDEISRLNSAIEEERERGEGKFLGSAFVRCNLQIGAHVLAQCPLTMIDKWMEAHPKDVVWRNLDDGALEMRGRYLTSWLATIGLIIGWAFPVTFIGTLSNVDDLCIKVHWLKWVCTSPDPVPALIQGVLPPALLAGLFALLPFILRALAWYECIPRYSLISVSVYRRFFLFLLIHGFLIVTLSSGITRAIQDIIEQPTQTVQKLAQQLPGASIFFLTYMLTQGFAGAGGALAQLMPLVLHYIRKWFLGRTPRQAFSVTYMMPSADFGIILPRLSLLATIAFAYSVLNPLINVMALLSYVMFYLAFKFLCTQVFDQPDQSETGGLYFPMAVSNLFVGLYIQQICLACLFFLKVSITRTSSIIEGAFMIILVAITACVQIYIHHSFDPITTYLPMSLATKKMAKRYEQRRQEKVGMSPVDIELDLFSRQHMKKIRKRIKRLPKTLDDKFDNLKSKVTFEDETKPKSSKEWKGSALNEDKEDFQSHEGDDIAEASGVDPRYPNATPELIRQGSDVSRTSTSSQQSNNSEKAGSSERSARTKSIDSSRPILEPPEPAEDGLCDEESDDEADQDEHAFDHPSTYVEQPWIWIPHDVLGLSQVLVDDLKKAGVEASDEGAMMDRKGVVEVTRNPPDEDWVGGHDR